MKSLMKKWNQWLGLRHDSEATSSSSCLNYLVPGNSFLIFPCLVPRRPSLVGAWRPWCCGPVDQCKHHAPSFPLFATKRKSAWGPGRILPVLTIHVSFLFITLVFVYPGKLIFEISSFHSKVISLHITQKNSFLSRAQRLP